MRKTVGQGVPEATTRATRSPSELDLQQMAHVAVTSEAPAHPIECAFDGHGGPGGTQWVASGPGPQTITLAFDSLQNVQAIAIEVEETSETRTQELELSLSSDGGASFHVVRRQEFNFSPDGSTFERERWDLERQNVTHVRLRIRPDKGGGAARARATTIAIEARTAARVGA
ncbi:MAG TPA: hypothetical protein VEK07_05180 [Polyangiaceae bacterium]|nr:hypothetical protein [Polyangiaceae bacterium]